MIGPDRALYFCDLDNHRIRRLDLKTRQLVVIAACATLGHAAPQLRAHIEGALAVGATQDEIVETILQTLFYAGGAAVANALQVAKDAFAQPTAPPSAAT